MICKIPGDWAKDVFLSLINFHNRTTNCTKKKKRSEMEFPECLVIRSAYRKDFSEEINVKRTQR